MGDSFFKIFFLSCFILLFLAGGIMFFGMQKETVDRREVKAYLNTHGKAPIPHAWRGEVGKGI